MNLLSRGCSAVAQRGASPSAVCSSRDGDLPLRSYPTQCQHGTCCFGDTTRFKGVRNTVGSCPDYPSVTYGNLLCLHRQNLLQDTGNSFSCIPTRDTAQGVSPAITKEGTKPAFCTLSFLHLCALLGFSVITELETYL